MSKSKYDTHILPYLDKITEWALKGATEKEIAKKLHVAYSTFRKYIDAGRDGDERYAALSVAYAQACEVPDDEVEASLYKLACGYTVEIKKTFKIKRAEFDPVTGRKIGEYEELVQGPDQVHVPANVMAQQFWLTNRRRDRWQYKPEAEKQNNDDYHGIVELPPVMEKPAEEGDAQ